MATKVKKINGVTLVFANRGFPINDLIHYMKLAESKDCNLDLGLANRVGAVLVFGKQSDLTAYRATNPTLSAVNKAQVEEARVVFDGEEFLEIENYITGYDRGQSADAMLCAATGLEVANNRLAMPQDDADMGRCKRLYESCGVVRRNAGQIEQLCPGWKPIIKQIVDDYADGIASRAIVNFFKG